MIIQKCRIIFIASKKFIHLIDQKFALFSINNVLIMGYFICYIVYNRTSGEDVIPHTPLSLLPLLSKINEQWTSDFETPQAQPHIKPLTRTTEKVTHLCKIHYISTFPCLFKLQWPVDLVNISDRRNT